MNGHGPTPIVSAHSAPLKPHMPVHTWIRNRTAIPIAAIRPFIRQRSIFMRRTRIREVAFDGFLKGGNERIRDQTAVDKPAPGMPVECDPTCANAGNHLRQAARLAPHSIVRGLDGIRTHDLLFRRQTLYPLSYKPVRQSTIPTCTDTHVYDVRTPSGHADISVHQRINSCS